MKKKKLIITLSQLKKIALHNDIKYPLVFQSGEDLNRFIDYLEIKDIKHRF